MDLTAETAGLGTELRVFGSQEVSVLFRTLQRKMYLSFPSHLSFPWQLACSRACLQVSIWFQAQLILPIGTTAVNATDNVFTERHFQTEHYKWSSGGLKGGLLWSIYWTLWWEVLCCLLQACNLCVSLKLPVESRKRDWWCQQAWFRTLTSIWAPPDRTHLLHLANLQ